MLDKWLKDLSKRPMLQLVKQTLRRSLHLSPHMSPPPTVMKNMTQIRRTIQKPRLYNGSSTSWKCLVVKNIEMVEVNEVWVKQKKALLDSITPEISGV